jgi:DNA repair protein RadC
VPNQRKSLVVLTGRRNVTHVPAEPASATSAPGVLERSATDQSTRELLQLLLTADVVDLDEIARLIDGGQIAPATSQPDELASLVELPERIVAVIAAALEIARRAAIGHIGRVIRGPADVAAIARRVIGGRTHECVLVVACDAANNVLKTMIVAQGSVDTAPAPVREILHAVLRCDGRSFAIAHNHPAGVLGSTDADVTATERITQAAHAVGLRFLGHVVVAGDKYGTVQPVTAGRTRC